MRNLYDNVASWSWPTIDEMTISIITLLLGISSVLVIMEALGFLPVKMSRTLNRNRLALTLDTLKAMGIDIDAMKRRNTAVALPEKAAASTLQKRILSRFDAITIEGPLQIGGTEVARGDKYVDLMGASTDPAVARQFARDLAAHWRNLVEERRELVQYDIDFICTPKRGSPFLGYEFAQILGKPLMLHDAEPKFIRDPEIAAAYFDCRSMPPAGARCLLVDDSSTGGGKARRAVDDLRRFGWIVSDALVVFAPKTKRANKQDAETRLKAIDVALHWIVET